MIRIERTSNISVTDQLVEQLRYQIASGAYKVNESLPPTRKLAVQLGISFHTVRKAYQHLVQEGVLSVQQGSGYKVLARAPLSSEERLERGASIVQDALQKLVGLGLEEHDIEYLVQEQLTIFETVSQSYKVVFASPYLEMAVHCSDHISTTLQLNADPVTISQISNHQDADYVLCRHADVRSISETYPRIDVIGISIYLQPDSLDRIAHLYSQETLGLIAYFADTIPHLMNEIQIQTGFSGQIFAASLEDGSSHLNQFIDQTDLIVYTPKCKRRLLSYTKSDKTFREIKHFVSIESLKTVQEAVPDL